MAGNSGRGRAEEGRCVVWVKGEGLRVAQRCRLSKPGEDQIMERPNKLKITGAPAIMPITAGLGASLICQSGIFLEQTLHCT